jgi:hypothetical protein
MTRTTPKHEYKVDLTPLIDAFAALGRGMTAMGQRINPATMQRLRARMERLERDRIWRDDPLQLKARLVDPVVEHFRAQTAQALEWMLERVKK